MKGIIIFLLLVIITFIGINQYQKYQRFHPKNANYNTQDTLDTAYHDQKVVLDYYTAIEELNGYIISQWSANSIDVRNPKKDNMATNYAVNEYSKKLGQVKYYEAILNKSAVYKAKGFSNEEIRLMEKKSVTSKVLAMQSEKEKFRQLFEQEIIRGELRRGQKGPWIYELQRCLTNNGYNIPVDGNFKEATYQALKDFETKNQLYADGILDQLTLHTLLKAVDSASINTLLVKNY